MTLKKHKLVSPKGAVFDLVLTVVFFCFMVTVLMPHVPAVTTKVQLIFASYASFCLSGVFWMAIGFLRVTCVDQMRRKKK